MEGLKRFLAVVLHPIFVPPLMLFVFLCTWPLDFEVVYWYQKDVFIIQSLVVLVLFPLISIVMMKQFGWLTSYRMPTKKERIGPYIVALVFGFWYYFNMKNALDVSPLWKVYIFGSVLALSIGFVINTQDKISLHMLAWSTAITTLFIGLAKKKAAFTSIPIGENILQLNHVLVVCALACTWPLIFWSRLDAKRHNTRQLLAGLLVGVISTLISLRLAY